jgi:hypothetical protein
MSRLSIFVHIVISYYCDVLPPFFPPPHGKPPLRVASPPRVLLSAASSITLKLNFKINFGLKGMK